MILGYVDVKSMIARISPHSLLTSLRSDRSVAKTRAMQLDKGIHCRSFDPDITLLFLSLNTLFVNRQLRERQCQVFTSLGFTAGILP